MEGFSRRFVTSKYDKQQDWFDYNGESSDTNGVSDSPADGSGYSYENYDNDFPDLSNTPATDRDTPGRILHPLSVSCNKAQENEQAAKQTKYQCLHQNKFKSIQNQDTLNTPKKSSRIDIDSKEDFPSLCRKASSSKAQKSVVDRQDTDTGRQHKNYTLKEKKEVKVLVNRDREASLERKARACMQLSYAKATVPSASQKENRAHTNNHGTSDTRAERAVDEPCKRSNTEHKPKKEQRDYDPKQYAAPTARQIVQKSIINTLANREMTRYIARKYSDTYNNILKDPGNSRKTKKAIFARKGEASADQENKINKLNEFLQNIISDQISERVQISDDEKYLNDIGNMRTSRSTSGEEIRNTKNVKQWRESGVQEKNGAQKTEVSLEELSQLIQSLTLNPDEDEFSKIQKMAEAVSSSTDLKEIASLIYKRCIDDREFGKSGACLCDRLANIDAEGTKFRNVMLSLVQVDYKDKDNIRKDNPGKFLGFVTFLCQVFGNMRTAKGEPFTVLSTPIYDCVYIIINDDSSSDDDYECLILQVQSIGKELESLDESKMAEFMEKVRTKLIKDGCSARARCSLLELFESYCKGWKTLPNEITRYYCDTMAEIFTDAICGES